MNRSQNEHTPMVKLPDASRISKFPVEPWCKVGGSRVGQDLAEEPSLTAVASHAACHSLCDDQNSTNFLAGCPWIWTAWGIKAGVCTNSGVGFHHCFHRQVPPNLHKPWHTIVAAWQGEDPLVASKHFSRMSPNWHDHLWLAVVCLPMQHTCRGLLILRLCSNEIGEEGTLEHLFVWKLGHNGRHDHQIPINPC